MLRETRAKWLALASALAVVMLAAGFAALRNLPDDATTAASTMRGKTADGQRIADETGRRTFERLGCAMCHSIAGRGNPASPLDGVGKRLDRAAVRDWTLGGGAAREQLPAEITAHKARAADDPEIDALIDYLSELR